MEEKPEPREKEPKPAGWLALRCIDEAIQSSKRVKAWLDEAAAMIEKRIDGNDSTR